VILQILTFIDQFGLILPKKHCFDLGLSAKLSDKKKLKMSVRSKKE